MKTIRLKNIILLLATLFVAGITASCHDADVELDQQNQKPSMYHIGDYVEHVDELVAFVKYNTELKEWYLMYSVPRTFDVVYRYFPAQLDKAFQKELLMVRFSGDVYETDIPTPIAGYKNYRIVLTSIHEWTDDGDNTNINSQMELSASDFEGVDWGTTAPNAEMIGKVSVRKNVYGQINEASFPADAGDQRPDDAEEFGKTYLGFDENNEFVLHHKDNEEYEQQWGVRNETYNQYYKGVRVNGTVYYFHFDHGVMTHANGVWFIIKDFDFQKKISKEQAKEIFAEFWGISPSQVVEKEEHSWNSFTNIEYCIAVLPKQGKLTPYLVYYITLDNVRVSESGTGIYGYVNAQTGKMVYAGELVLQDM